MQRSERRLENAHVTMKRKIEERNETVMEKTMEMKGKPTKVETLEIRDGAQMSKQRGSVRPRART